MAEKEAQGAVIGVTDDGFPIVTEDYSCPHWAGSGRGLATMRECWYCKYADFRKSTEIHIKNSICRCKENKVDTQLGFIKNEL